MLCVKCNNQLKQGASFCGKCGAEQQLQGVQKAPAQKQVAGSIPHSQGMPLRVISLQKKFTLVACLKDLLLPGNGFLYAERMSEGAVVGLMTIPLTIWAVFQYIQLFFTDVLNNLRNLGAEYYTPDYSTSNNFKAWLLALSLIWLVIRCLWLWYCVQEHNRKITKQADINQLIAFVDEK